jgi:predicted DNA-binding transcriptional regulator YafY
MALMRADRLVAILLLLQRRGRVTAAEVAEELEVSERTARRDLEALGVAGLPIYSQQGRGGGWRLAGGGRTDLSGLSAAEARALFLAAGPSSSASPHLQGALRKLVRALPEPFRLHAEAASSALVVDPSGWDDVAEVRPPPEHLDALQVAVIEGQQVHLGYVARDRASSTRVVHPLGLVSKGPSWYLVAGTDAGLRTFRVDRVTSVEGAGAPVVRPEGFELSEAWRLIADDVDRRRTPLTVLATAAPEHLPLLHMVLRGRVRVGAPGADGRVALEIRAHGARAIAAELAGLGDAVEVLEPPEVRARLASIGAELHRAYADERRPDAGQDPVPSRGWSSDDPR